MYYNPAFARAVASRTRAGVGDGACGFVERCAWLRLPFRRGRRVVAGMARFADALPVTGRNLVGSGSRSSVGLRFRRTLVVLACHDRWTSSPLSSQLAVQPA